MSNEDRESTHCKRLAQILRYIASMHQSLTTAEEGSSLFVRSAAADNGDDGRVTDFFQGQHENDCVLFSTDNFRQLLALESNEWVSGFRMKPSPFSFYAAAVNRPNSHASKKKRSFTSAFPQSFRDAAASATNATGKTSFEKICWLRITRLTQAQLAGPADMEYYLNLPSVQAYLRDWQRKNNATSVEHLLTHSIPNTAPKLAPTLDSRSRQDVKIFMRKHKKQWIRRTYQNTLEPIYNRLFEWIQNDRQLELVWGLGHARMLIPDEDEESGTERLLNGPLLEVLMEVELSRDGALLVRPRDHTGVTLNRQVVAALSQQCGPSALASLHQTVAELEPAHLSPGQPNTYIPLLKRIAVELCAGGSFQHSSSDFGALQEGKLVVTEAWCLYCRSKPNSVWARDASALADQLQSRGRAVQLPQAAWALTYGPSALSPSSEDETAERLSRRGTGFTFWHNWFQSNPPSPVVTSKARPLFPLPTSAAQNRIADLLLNQNYPAVVCEGPPGTGKTHSIANIICAYLCQGKRVLVTSKNAPALSVLRHRLPASVRDLCVDVSMSELSGMHQLQQTVERLSNRICSVSSIIETEKCRYLQGNIADLEKELETIDEQLAQRIENASQVFRKNPRLLELQLSLIEEAPWITKQLTEWTVKDVITLRDRVESFLIGDDDPLHQVSGFQLPVSDALISKVASMAGSALLAVKDKAETTLSMLPLVGRLSGLQDRVEGVQEMLAGLTVRGDAPSSQADWRTVLKAMERAKAICLFDKEIWQPMQRARNWPSWEFHGATPVLRELHSILSRAVESKELVWALNAAKAVKIATEAQSQDTRRGVIVSRIQQLAKELVDCKVVMELNRSFSVDAQSALIRFAQIAGKARFTRNSQPSKMTQRQRRRRQEYLEAFDQCCRFIPCWILTTSQISDYLPQECLFDLVICDESSQSEVVSAIPGMMRGKQWLVVGDTKQVSPTDCFVAEGQIESLRASLPSSPFSDSFLPGQSFFDLCAQAFPRGRVVLSEHFRCAEEIIAFSNEQFYDGRLVPLRLPNKSERLTPSLVDVRINGVKSGKVNAREADEIVSRVEALVTSNEMAASPRSIGVISLMGDEQSRLIRGRLLDVVGPQKMAEHNILVGDPPKFQGAERDIVFLSMVVSPGSVPTQSQLMHFQRANVALSRARDQCILVRSVELNDIPGMDDIKVPIIEFFRRAADQAQAEDVANTEVQVPVEGVDICPAQVFLKQALSKRGFSVRGMGIVWKNGVCVEHESGDNRVALLVEGAGESLQQWKSSFEQQKAIERVGWKCLRIDALSLLTEFDVAFESVVKFLAACGIEEPPLLYDSLESDNEADDQQQVQGEDSEEEHGAADQAMPDELDDAAQDEGPRGVLPLRRDDGPEDVVVISSDEEEGQEGSLKPAAVEPRLENRAFQPDLAPSGPLEDARNDLDASNYGEVVDLSFLRGENGSRPSLDRASLSSRARSSTRRDTGNKAALDHSQASSDEDEYQADAETDGSRGARPHKRRRLYRRLGRYQRDGRWYPGSHKESAKDDTELQDDWYDTNSDLEEDGKPAAADH